MNLWLMHEAVSRPLLNFRSDRQPLLDGNHVGKTGKVLKRIDLGF